LLRFLDHAHTHTRAHARTRTHTRQDSSERVISSPQRLLLIQHTTETQETNIYALNGIEPSIPAVERPQTYALDRTFTAIGSNTYI